MIIPNWLFVLICCALIIIYIMHQYRCNAYNKLVREYNKLEDKFTYIGGQEE